MNLQHQNGLSYPTTWTLFPPPPPANLAQIDSDPTWLSWTYPWSPSSYLKAASHLRFYSPLHGVDDPSTIDLWLTPLSSTDNFNNEAPGSVVDHWAPLLENYRLEDSDFSTPKLAARAAQVEERLGSGSIDHGGGRAGERSCWLDGLSPLCTYPTLSMTLNIKKVLPREGVKWLFLRARLKTVENGRLDAEVLVLDEKLELVAISLQVSFYRDGSRHEVEACEALNSILCSGQNVLGFEKRSLNRKEEIPGRAEMTDEGRVCVRRQCTSKTFSLWDFS